MIPAQLTRYALFGLMLTACATTPPGTPTAGLAHGQSGRFHVLLGEWPRVQEACRGLGVQGEGAILGCWLAAGETHWIWAAVERAQSGLQRLAEVLAHEIRHTHEGAWHP